MSDLTLEVRPLGGTDIRRALEETIALRKRIGINISFSFNDVYVFICSDDQTADDLSKRFDKVVGKPNAYLS